ncbi:uncharacterized protein LY89DRAFT_697981 [Mollisia scopiformis]|uniref:ferric-chelate reductase (NADPH) n=1 Tax=Mollisia scopiformis TaxID=149040 RepID=A0A194X760_MOLSC|nr:uncharacterized protein LY89DRAFT_697981 [Mollisia scopiformis]KUJ16010.1 hypothetical protein LY89DRAFT_697981 [Mollisia scopiformis]
MSGMSISSDALSTDGLDMTNMTVAMDFLGQLLDDTELQVTSNHFATIFWYGIVVVIGLATLSNIFLRLRSWSRNAASNKAVPVGNAGSGKGDFGLSASFLRKISYPHVSPTHHPRLLKVPPLGTIIMLVAYLCFVLGLEYVKQDVPGEQHNQAIGVRAGWLTITQMPLLILLSGKVNLIGLLSGVSYERLNVFHRWVARTMLLTATLHMGYQQALWNKLGMKAYAFLVWLNLSTLAPIRNRFYEFFVIQHILSFICFVTFIMLHLPTTALYTRVYIWIPIGLYFLDRLLRSIRYAWNNIRPGRATLIRQHGDVTKVLVRSRQLKSWTPGSFVLLSIPRFGIMQSHPATIASVPTSNNGELIFFLRAHRGFTSHIYKEASDISITGSDRTGEQTHLALIDGPYGGTHLDFASFSQVVLIAGSTGITFILPILLDIAFRAPKTTLPVKEVVLVWAIKTSACMSWVTSELQQGSEALRSVGIKLIVRLFVTADEGFVDESETENVGDNGCQCDLSSGECVCAAKVVKQRTDDSTSSVGEKIKDGATEQPGSAASIGIDEDKAKPPAGRPGIRGIIAQAQGAADGEIGVAVCGPLGMVAVTRCAVAGLETGTRGIYLHAESFGM